MKTILVKVTKRDIENGEPCNCYYCPVALALHCLKGLNGVAVHEGFVEKWSAQKQNFIELSLPIRAKRFIKQFDRGNLLKPFSFRLKVP